MSLGRRVHVDPRQRSGQTKRERSRNALVNAAITVFAERGWHGSRLEDIARAAGVSVPTAYNHFPGGKQELMGVAYAPLIEPFFEAVEAAITTLRDPLKAITQLIHQMCTIMRAHQALTAALVSAVSDQTARVGAPTDPGDVRNLVPTTAPLIQLIQYGQDLDIFNTQLDAKEVGAYHGNGLLLRLLTRPNETAEETAGFVLSQMLPALGI
ncbi:TetR/AcrR family transcriptional regulator [Streptomyces sp. NBC_00986]|uniref:TetR/AcrR family transcriptional regulator n=1 Tax=Streptomyces sp. NBC_00986 TaxID=2903702 RepID=UPI003867FA9C|nr:TetR/AcrR family transcriptional regulator [Streptomyces sp. NBC_00986]